MPKCAHCGGGKARRACPAYDAHVCPRCCGAHQRRAIDCPDGCAYLREKGGGRGIRKVSAALMEFALGWEDWRDRANRAYFAGPAQPAQPWEQALLGAFAAVGFADAHGRRAVDHWAERHRAELRPDDQEALDTLREAQFSMFEVESLRKGEGMTVLDLVSRERLRIRERTATHQLVRYDLMLGWIVPVSGHWELMGAQCEVPRHLRDRVLEALVGAITAVRERAPGASPSVIMSEAVPATLAELRRAVEEQTRPGLVTTDGEPIIFCEAAFAVQDAAAVRSRLELHPDVDREHDGYVWLSPAPAGADPEEAPRTVWGRLFFREERLILSTPSRERLERGKALLGPLLTGVAAHLLDTLEDLAVAMAAASERAQRAKQHAPPSPLSDDERAAMGARFLEDHLRRWIDEPLPALDGGTMREAAKSKTGRVQVIELLKDQEHSAQRMPGGDRVDFDRVWAELGLER